VASNNREKASAEESEKIVHGSLGYFGIFTTNEVEKSFTVQIEGSTFPNFVGTSQTRSYAISGDELRCIKRILARWSVAGVLPILLGFAGGGRI
jgi:hypothetical protein